MKNIASLISISQKNPNP